MDQECPGKCAGGGGSPPTPRTRNTSRVSSVTVTRTPIIEDDPALNAIMSNVFAPINYQQRTSPGRSPQGQGPVYGPAPFNPNATGASEYKRFEESLARRGGESSGISPSQPTTRFGGSMVCGSEDFEEEPPDEKAAAEKEESIIEWFDRNVENELQKRREKSMEIDCRTRKVLQSPNEKYGLHVSQLEMEKLAEATASGAIEVPVQLRMEPDTELTDAVDKLAKAEAMCAFAAAVQAAEQAAEAAPPELAEEAAAMGAARGFQADVKEVRQVLPGERPIEVVGYVGITRPKDPKRSQQ